MLFVRSDVRIAPHPVYFTSAAFSSGVAGRCSVSMVFQNANRSEIGLGLLLDAAFADACALANAEIAGKGL